ncbi:MAG TPA: hypothetical protein VKG21_20360 [Casimicrobiaceae bacterium]|nr:hypothetical protein [Casimicrobiaceae bacterium]
MNAIDHTRGCNLCALFALSALLLASQTAFAGTTIVYKCLDRNLGVVYTDEPCKGGERMTIRAGDADPAAVARLERERDALGRSAEQRIMDERRIAVQRDLMVSPAYPVDQPSNYYNGYYNGAPYDYGWAGAYPIYPVQPHRPRSPRGQRFGDNPRAMVRG